MLLWLQRSFQVTLTQQPSRQQVYETQAAGRHLRGQLAFFYQTDTLLYLKKKSIAYYFTTFLFRFFHICTLGNIIVVVVVVVVYKGLQHLVAPTLKK
jgi:hypothetical protein